VSAAAGDRQRKKTVFCRCRKKKEKLPQRRRSSLESRGQSFRARKGYRGEDAAGVPLHEVSERERKKKRGSVCISPFSFGGGVRHWEDAVVHAAQRGSRRGKKGIERWVDKGEASFLSSLNTKKD